MIVGHALQIKNLKKLADAGALAHSYIFFGVDGIGKKQVALGLARYLEKKQFEPEGTILNDVLCIAPDENRSIGIEAVRTIKSFLWQKPNASTRRTLIIDDAETLTNEAQHALLKISEEPPESALMILVSTNPDHLHETLASRFMKIHFSHLKKEVFKKWLTGTGLASAKETEMLEESSFGRPGLALRLLQDEAFKKNVALGEALLKTSLGDIRDYIKTLLADETFQFNTFLDALILAYARRDLRPLPKRIFWHRLLELRKHANFATLNPRIQLENLLLYT